MATLGGIIEINGALFGLSVSHVFPAQTPSDDGTSSEHESDGELFVIDEDDLDEDDLDPFVRSMESDKEPDVVETYSRSSEVSDPSDKFTQASETAPDVEDDIVDRETPKWYVLSRRNAYSDKE